MKELLLIGLIASGLSAGLIVSANAQEDDPAEDDSLRCIDVRSVRSADVIDDDHVVFEVQGRRLYLNALPKSCVGLSRDRRFAYEMYMRSLCERDKIRILRGSGSGLYAGKACGLGRFQPIEVEELQRFIDERTALAVESGESESEEVEEAVEE